MRRTFVFLIRTKRALWHDISRAWWKAVVVLAVAGGAFYLYDLSSACLWFVFTAFLLYGWDNRYLGAAAILCLTACPMLLALDSSLWWPTIDFEAAAESVAVYAFFFLVMTVVLQLVDLKRHPGEYAD